MHIYILIERFGSLSSSYSDEYVTIIVYTYGSYFVFLQFWFLLSWKSARKGHLKILKKKNNYLFTNEQLKLTLIEQKKFAHHELCQRRYDPVRGVAACQRKTNIL